MKYFGKHQKHISFRKNRPAYFFDTHNETHFFLKQFYLNSHFLKQRNLIGNVIELL